MNALTLAALLAGAVFPAYPLPGVVANGPAPMFSNAEDAALCEDALWVDLKGLPEKPKDQARYDAARAVCDKAKDSLEPGIRVIVEGSFTLSSPHPGLAALRVQASSFACLTRCSATWAWLTSGFPPTASKFSRRR